MPGELCCAVGCSNNTGGNHSVSYHRFPGETVRRENWTPTNSSRLCSEHFTADSHEGTTLLKLEFGLASCNRRLKRASVPTLFKHTEPRRPPIERGAAIKRKRSQSTREGFAEFAADALQGVGFARANARPARACQLRPCRTRRREAAASDQGVSTDPVMDVDDDSAEVSAETDLLSFPLPLALPQYSEIGCQANLRAASVAPRQSAALRNPGRGARNMTETY
ncbi:hypothetical protein HPB47_002169 [Ixodes persulcatus]|uniref:Uncharacterized protein n=1 Tax=Ixodes persulcatus TaxID=34615 RepID=A0AC60PLZ4_IXOPE|nr:hypothetical protein HPB47_002169 [Ixodes persulcatus]